jgi:hypothetical protein
MEGDGSKGKVGNSTAYFCSLTDRNNLNYEPIQMAMALRNDKGEKNPALFNCYVSPSTRAAIKTTKIYENQRAGF